MKTKSIVVAIMAIGSLTSISAFAQPNNWRGSDDHDNRRNPHNQVSYYHRDGDFRKHDDRKNVQWHSSQIRRFDNDRYRPVYIARRDWREGQYLPSHYRGRQYVVNNWRERNLYAPPRGYYWVDAGSDFILTAIATNLIMQIVRH